MKLNLVKHLRLTFCQPNSLRFPRSLAATIFMFSLALSPGARAAEGDAAANEGADIEVVVSATKTERKLQDTPGSVSVINRAELDRENVNDLTDIVRYETDVSVPRSLGGTGPGFRSSSGAQDFNIRGIDGNRVLMNIDGIRQPDQFTFGGTTAIGRDYLDLNAYKRVEIVKGAASSLYGSDAIGGVVTFVTRDPSDFLGVVSTRPFAFSLKLGYDGANDSFFQSAAAAFQAGKVEFLAIYTHAEGNEYKAAGDYPTNPANFSVNAFLGKVLYRWNAENVTTVTGEYFDQLTNANLLSSRRLTTTSGPAPGQITDTFTNNVDLDTNLNRYRLSLGHVYTASGSGDKWFAGAQFNIYYQNSQTDENSVDNTFRVRSPGTQNFINVFRESQYTQDIVGGWFQFQSRFTLGEVKNRLIYGFEANSSSLERNRNGISKNLTLGTTTNFIPPDTFPVKDIPDSTILRIGGFIQDEIAFGKEGWFTLIPGLRFDSYRATSHPDAIYLNTSGGTQPIDYNNFVVTPKIAAVIRIDSHLSITGQYTRGFRNPTVEDLNGTVTNLQFGYMTIPNRNLKSESSDGYELTLRGSYPMVAFSLAGYYNRYQNFIESFAPAGFNPITGFLLFQSQNIGRAEIYGFEAKAEVFFGYFTKSLNGFSFLTSVGAAHGNDLVNHTGLNSVDPLKFINALRYTSSNKIWGADLIATYVSRKGNVFYGPPATTPPALPVGSNPLESGQFVPPSYFSLDAIGYAKITKYVTVNLGVYNLTNSKYWIWQDVIGLPVNRVDLGRFTQPPINVKASVTMRF